MMRNATFVMSEAKTYVQLSYKCEKADSVWKDFQTRVKTIGFNNYV